MLVTSVPVPLYFERFHSSKHRKTPPEVLRIRDNPWHLHFRYFVFSSVFGLVGLLHERCTGLIQTSSTQMILRLRFQKFQNFFKKFLSLRNEGFGWKQIESLGLQTCRRSPKSKPQLLKISSYFHLPATCPKRVIQQI